jgi:hypothetical protein
MLLSLVIRGNTSSTLYRENLENILQVFNVTKRAQL